jgi:hypothetical protein
MEVPTRVKCGEKRRWEVVPQLRSSEKHNQKLLLTPTLSFRRKTFKSTAKCREGELYKSFSFMLHHLLSTRFSDTPD